jgi:succinate-semialdehyde dehydrogenase/glutarate-semialdehyde dehydrogenase
MRRGGEAGVEASLYIEGEWREAVSGRKMEVRDPARGVVIGEVADGGPEEARAAVEAAVKAFAGWGRRPAAERAALLERLASRLEAGAEEMRRCLIRESGKPGREAAGEVGSSIAFLRWNAEEAKRCYGRTVESSEPDIRLWTVQRPVGVASIITPWNYPLNTLCRKLGPALGAGCTVVLKPAPETPLSAIELVRMAEEVGFPRGVLNLVTTSRAEEVVGAWLDDARVRKVAFTGSTAVGKHLARESAATLKRVSLELGGHAPAIVFADADLDRAAEGIVASRFRHAGQTCICVQRVLAEESIVEPLLARLAERITHLRVGNGEDPLVEVGPLIHEGAIERVCAHLDDAVTHGARIVTGGQRLHLPSPNLGAFFQPTLLADVSPTMRVMREETFGPLLAVSPFRDEEEAIGQANATSYGLAAYLFTNHAARIHRMVDRLEFGTIGINEVRIIHPGVPFGGVKESGLGRENGSEGIHEYLEVRSAVLQVPVAQATSKG